MPGDFGGPVCSCAFSLVGLHTRPRVHRAPGIPARPLFSRAAENNGKPRAVLAARMRTHVLRTLCLVVTPMFQRRALATKQSTLASSYVARWIASLTLAMTALTFEIEPHLSSPDQSGDPGLRDGRDRIEKPQRTGSPAFAEDDDLLWSAVPAPHSSL